MPQFVVPQFIDVEDKIIGPITVRQFIMGVAGALLIFLAYRFADTALFIIEALLIFGIYVLIAFVKVNGRASYYFLLSVIQSLMRPALRVWMKQYRLKRVGVAVSAIPAESRETAPRKIRLPQASLASLALLVDTGGKYRPEEILKQRSE